ncbi:MAG TPA: hypothetical protein VFK89_03970 [Actinomycetota bacterium]|nr:hypothetical protein [Actinomycetota bacterium]
MTPDFEIWRDPDGLWRWRYVEKRDDSDDLVLESNEAYLDQEEALAAARTAYPDVLPEVPASFARSTKGKWPGRRDDATRPPAPFVVFALYLVWRAWKGRARGNN